jgi:single-stranded-DNA-specific exonuclease
MRAIGRAGMDGENKAFGVSKSFSDRSWALSGDEDKAAELARQCDLSPVLAHLLAGRGIAEAAVADYLEPTLKRLMPEPLTLAGMAKAVARVKAAIGGGETIAVFGDYDVDGSCSSAMLHDFLAAVASPPRLYIPDRLGEGYGPNAPALLKLKDEGASLVICADCGAGAGVALAAARDAGLDVVVLDHHAAQADVPAVAQVNPNRAGDESGLGHLCAAGVTFLFLVALNRALREAGHYAQRPEPDLRECLDLVALATVCDVVPLTGVNRAFVRTGLARMSKLERPGLNALAEVARVAPPFSPYTLGFVLGPRINAGGRVGRCSLGADLLTTRDPALAEDYAAALDTHNRERQAIEKLILDEAAALAERQTENPFLFVTGDGWHSGVVGIVAGRLKERFNKPALVAGFEGGMGRGSARSVVGVDLGAMIRAAAAAGVIDAGGGHAMAAGFSLRREQAEPFRAFLAGRFATAEPAAEVGLAIEAVVSPNGATLSLVDEISRLGPFGAGNPEPLVGIPGVMLSYADVVGQYHLRLRLGGGGGRLDAIAFRAADTPLGQGLLAARGRKIHVAGRLRLNEWNGRTSIQLHLEDAASAEA